MNKNFSLYLTFFAVLVAACSPSQPSTSTTGRAPAEPPPEQAKPLVVFIRIEPASVAVRAFTQTSAALRTPFFMFNALVARADAKGQPQPELVTSLPALNTDTWQVFPDGTMQTTYTLRPNLTWHDGQPLTAEDFAFAYQVYATPDLGLATHAPIPAISDVTATDSSHFTIRWRVPSPDAETISDLDRELPPLPKHILGTPFDNLASTGKEPLATHPYWGPQFVGLGPYKMQQWEAGSYIDAVRFDSYVFGSPKIPRIRLRFSADQNVVVTNLLAGEAHVATANALAQNPEALAEQWGRTGAGTIAQFPSSMQYMGFQLRPDYAKPAAILDVRVRRAIAHAIDKQAIIEAIFGPGTIAADTPVWTESAWGAAMDSSIPRYPLDLRATETFMNQAGYFKGSEGLFRGPEGKLSFELATTEDPDTVREILVMANRLGAAGFDVQQRVIPASQVQNSELRATFPTFQMIGTYIGQAALDRLASNEIPSPANRWVGGNRGGWSSPEMDRLLASFNTTLDRNQRLDQVRQMLRLFADDLPWVAMVFRATSFAYVKELTGPGLAAPESDVGWDIYNWEFKS